MTISRTPNGCKSSGFAYLITFATVVYVNFWYPRPADCREQCRGNRSEYPVARATLSYRHRRRSHLLRRRGRASHSALRDSQAGQ